MAAANPYYIFMSVLLLSEAVFVPLMLAALWGLAVLWVEPGRSEWRDGCCAACSIALGERRCRRPGDPGPAVVALYVPVVLVLWIIAKCA